MLKLVTVFIYRTAFTLQPQSAACELARSVIANCKTFILLQILFLAASYRRSQIQFRSARRMVKVENIYSF